jgi:hypothetical protein
MLAALPSAHRPFAAAPPSLPLSGWLNGLATRGDEILLGGTGHLLLNAEEEQNVAAQLREGVLPRLFPHRGHAGVCLLTGLAPGADLLFAQVLSGWLRDNGIPFRIAGLLPVPPEVLLRDWSERLRDAGAKVSAAQSRERRRQIESTLAECEMVVDLLPPGTDAAELRSLAFREQQYRRLAACLAQRSDILVAILRRENALRPGGTAEVVDWRRHPQHIPPEFCTDPPPPTDGGHRLVVIDPALGYTASD